MTASHPERDGPSPGDPRSDTIDFGFERVPLEEKRHRVRGVFDSVAERYDLMNDLMSMGVHRLWKRSMIEALAPRPGMRLLDVAGGTGDIAFRFMEKLGSAIDRTPPPIVSDANAEMLGRGLARAIDRGWSDRPLWVAGDAEALPIPDMSVDAVTIAFGLRNVTGRLNALREMRRVLKPGGRFLCLEFSRVTVPALRSLYEAYSFRAIPEIGRRVTGDREAYRYLVESIAEFPPQEQLADMMREAGLDRVSWRDMSGGIVALHSGWRL